jgi:hypothetical protein
MTESGLFALSRDAVLRHWYWHGRTTFGEFSARASEHWKYTYHTEQTNDERLINKRDQVQKRPSNKDYHEIDRQIENFEFGNFLVSSLAISLVSLPWS